VAALGALFQTKNAGFGATAGKGTEPPEISVNGFLGKTGADAPCRGAGGHWAINPGSSLGPTGGRVFGGRGVGEVVGWAFDGRSLDEMQARVVGKREKERLVFFGEPCRDALQNYLHGPRETLLGNAEQPFGEKAVFLSRLGRRLNPTAVNKLVEKYVLRVGVSHHITPHKLRHTFATHMLDAGADLRTIQELLGHESLVSTEIYTHVSTAGLKRVYASAHPLANDRKG